MARHPYSPLSEQHTMTSSGFVGTSNGFYVSGLSRLHLTGIDNVSLVLEGRISNTDVWEKFDTIPSKNGRSKKNIDISEWEYIRLDGTLVNSSSANIRIFAYPNENSNPTVVASFANKEFENSLDNKELLREINCSLKQIVQHLECITGEDFYVD